MKKLFLMMAVAIMSLGMISCATESDKQCKQIADAMLAGNVEEVANLTNALYNNPCDSKARNFADLSIAFNYLANQAQDNVTRYDYAQKVVDCYKKAVAADEGVTAKCYEVAKLDMASIVAQYEQMFPQFEAAIAAEQAAAQAQEEAADGEEEVVEE